MSEHTELSAEGVVEIDDHSGGHDHPTERKYIEIAVILAIITGLEVAVYYIKSLRPLIIPVLGVLAAAKFIMVVAYYMHLKFDSKIFRRFFVLGIVLAFAVFTIVLLTFLAAVRVPGAPGA